MGPTQNQLTAEARGLKEKASQMFEFVYSQPGDFGAREIDTRTKERPANGDIENINIVEGEMINQHIISPVEDPFIFLWIANCALYSTVATFLFLKKWK